MRYPVVMAMLLAAVGLLSCRDEREAGAPPGKDVSLGADSFGQTVKVGLGDRVHLALTENPATGYKWECKWDPTDGLALVRDSFQGPASAPTGAGGTRHFLLLARRPGRVNITLQYRRPWEKGEAEPAKTIVLEVAGE